MTLLVYLKLYVFLNTVIGNYIATEDYVVAITFDKQIDSYWHG